MHKDQVGQGVLPEYSCMEDSFALTIEILLADVLCTHLVCLFA